MKKLFISTLLVLGFSMSVSAQRPPAPPHPSKMNWSILKCRSWTKNTIPKKADSESSACNQTDEKRSDESFE
jgi:hypothetical protein